MANEVSYGRIGFVVRGQYSPNIQYERLDVVSYAGNAYVAKVAVTAEAPDTGTNWMLLVRGGMNAYEIALENGFKGSASEWLVSLAEPSVIAAEVATAAAERAAVAASDADVATAAANAAAQSAGAAALKLSGVDLSVKMLPPSAAPTAAVAQSERQTTFSLGIPKSNVAMATFEVDANAHLIMTTLEGLDNVGFAINRDNGHLEVTING